MTLRVSWGKAHIKRFAARRNRGCRVAIRKIGQALLDPRSSDLPRDGPILAKRGGAQEWSRDRLEGAQHAKIVVSRTLESPQWSNNRVVRDATKLGDLRQHSNKAAPVRHCSPAQAHQ